MTHVGLNFEPRFACDLDPARATIRGIVDSNPRQYVLLIAAVVGSYYGIVTWFLRKYAPNGPLAHSPPLWLVAFGAMGAALGIAALYFCGFFYQWVGRLFGGVANYTEVRTALAWSWVPIIYIAVAAVPSDYWLLRKAFSDWASMLHQHARGFLQTPWEPSSWERPLISISIVAVLAGQIWWYVISAKCLGEVNRFSAWLGFATGLLGFFATVFGLMISVVGVWALCALIYFAGYEIAHVLH